MPKAVLAVKVSLIGLIGLLSACTQRRDVAAELRYVKDKHQVCYAVLDSESDTSIVLSLTSVPCEKVGL